MNRRERPTHPKQFIPSVQLSISATGAVLERLTTLKLTGLWGKTEQEVAERLLCDRLRQQDLRDCAWKP